MMKFLRTKKRLVVLAVVMTLLLVVVPVAQAWPFGDVPVGYWAYNAIRRVAYLNITSGCGGGNYCPEAYVTRAQMAGFMNNLTKAYTTEDEPYILNLDHRDIAMNRPAIVGQSNDGNGVEGRSYGAGYADNGVYGESNSTDSGEAGVYGRGTSNAAGVRGSNIGSGYGVYGTTATGRGVYGYASSSAPTVNYGVYGYTASVNGFGVAGYQSGSPGWNSGYYEPGGWFSGQNGVVGTTSLSNGVAVMGDARNTGAWSGYFYSSGQGVGISAGGAGHVGLVVSGGTKSAGVATDEGSRLLYTEEATEVWFADYGFGQLEDGAATIAIDPLFAETVNLEEPYHVFVQVYGDAEVFVSDRTAAGFEVRLRDGDPNVPFSYRLVAKRLGFEGERLAPAPWLDSDPNLFQGVTPGSPGLAGEGELIETDTSPPPLEPLPEEGK